MVFVIPEPGQRPFLFLRKYKCQLVPKGSEVKMNMHELALGLGKLET